YIGRRDQTELGAAYFDSHLVRTLPETIMVVVDPAGRIVRIEVLSFSEPEEYRPRPAWIDQFDRQALAPELSLKRAIHGLTGATLSARAITEAARRVLALHQVVREPQAQGAGG
ncbi:MAG TPA: FMN-binding protein, partial [Acidobacteriota bacterium]